MKIKGQEYKTIWFENNIVKIIDQTKLPHKFQIKELKSLDDAINAIDTPLDEDLVHAVNEITKIFRQGDDQR